MKSKIPGATGVAAAPFAVFTSVDGTLLDARTFELGPNRAVIKRLVDSGIPVVPVTVMTFDEVAPIAEELGLRHAMVIEAGGAIARWKDGVWDVEPYGPPADTLLDVVAQIEERSGADLLVYSALDAADAATLSGRTGAMLRASTIRCFSEPFVIERGDLAEVKRAADSLGFSVRRGRRFLHLCRKCDEGHAYERLREELRCEVAVGIGSAAIDAEFLARADIAVIIPGPDGEVDPELRKSVPDARIASAPGPAGWALAIDEVCQNLLAPRARRA
ncbi:MAG TPA: HAD hydrolase family protein [Thermoanaerobaculia bacterium]|nr:HAD hydrolase family protein [Thermoanaerobaculia bacterium]